MKVLVNIVAGLGALVLTATTIGLPDVCGYCTARAVASQSQHVGVGGSQESQPAHRSVTAVI